MTAVRRIMWVNPIGHPGYDQPMGEMMAAAKLPGTTIDMVSLNSPGLPLHLEYRTYESFIIADMVRLARHAHEQDYDALVIGCFYDPGIEEAREISGSTVIVGPCQASLQIAANLANRFSIVIGQEKWAGQMHERAHTYGYGARIASMPAINIAVPDLQKDCGLTASRIIEAGRKAMMEDKAEALILGCTCTFGLHEQVQKELGIPVIDPILAAFKMAEFLGGLRRQFAWVPSRVWSAAPPPETEITAFGMFKSGAPIGNQLRY